MAIIELYNSCWEMSNLIFWRENKVETLKAIVKRKSTRAFSPEKQVGESELKTILSAGCTAPVGGADYASIHLTVIKDKAILAKITKAVQTAFKFDRDVLYGAPVLVLVSSSEPKFPNIHYANAGCIIENMLLAATDLGIDSVYLWGAATVTAKIPELLKEIGVPEGFTPISGAAFGYAAESNPTEKKLEVTLSVNYV